MSKKIEKSKRNECKYYGKLEKAKVLLIAHDPTLRNSDDIAEYCLYADYATYNCKVEKTKPSDKRKQGLANSAYNMIKILTNGKYKEDEILMTNLCNKALHHAPKGKTILIPEYEVNIGIKEIEKLLEKGSFEYVFSTSLQVNYWLVKNGFYKCDSFLRNTRLSQSAINAEKPFFRVTKSGTFKSICGNVYDLARYNAKIIPILHPKNYPLKGDFEKAYKSNYENVKNYFC